VLLLTGLRAQFPGTPIFRANECSVARQSNLEGMLDWLCPGGEAPMSESLDHVGWATVIADDALTGTTYQVSYQSFTGQFRVNGVEVQRTKMFETPGEETENTLAFQGEGIIAHLKLSDLQHLLN